MKEFKTSASSDPIEFKVGQDTFIATAPAKLPGIVMVKYIENVTFGRLHSALVALF